MWEASGRICGKRLKAILPELLAAMERHGYLNLDPEVRILVPRVSAAKDPFETVWYRIFHWLQENPESTAKEVFERL